MKHIVAIDPGNLESAYVYYDPLERSIFDSAKLPCARLLHTLRHFEPGHDAVLAVEMMASYGMPVGSEVFDTCVWIGRFLEAWYDDGLWGGDYMLLYRPDIKLHLTGQRRAKDANVRQALIDRFGPSKEIAIGRKASPGPLYGITGDCWSALAVAVTAADTIDAPAA